MPLDAPVIKATCPSSVITTSPSIHACHLANFEPSELRQTERRIVTHPAKTANSHQTSWQPYAFSGNPYKFSPLPSSQKAGLQQDSQLACAIPIPIRVKRLGWKDRKHPQILGSMKGGFP
jgi:hypothetical protein